MYAALVTSCYHIYVTDKYVYVRWRTKTLNVDAAHGLLSRGVSVGEAATILARERSISLRQAYRYLERARKVGRAIPAIEPSVPAAFKIPHDVLAQLRAYSGSSGLTLSATVTLALEKCLTATRLRR